MVGFLGSPRPLSCMSNGWLIQSILDPLDPLVVEAFEVVVVVEEEEEEMEEA